MYIYICIYRARCVGCGPKYSRSVSVPCFTRGYIRQKKMND